MNKICLEHLIILDSKEVTKYYYQKGCIEGLGSQLEETATGQKLRTTEALLMFNNCNELKHTKFIYSVTMILKVKPLVTFEGCQ